MPQPAKNHPGRPALGPRAAAFLLAAGAPAAVWGVCSCGFGDGQFTLTTIGVDGDLSDWTAVLADIDNNVCDGPSGGLTDRDAPVQSTGRDLTHFAYTWDNGNIYLFTERFGTSNNTQSFVYYADVDNDLLMETGEPVIGVSWQGNNRSVAVYIFSYVSDAPGGDSMADGAGFGDGYTLPGSFANVPPSGNPTRAGSWGSANGLQMEFYVTWAELGLPLNSPFTFHVSSSNASLGAASFTSQVDDNLSGCGGRIGSTIIPAVQFVPDRTLTGFAAQTVAAVHTVTNGSNASDSFDLTSAASGDFAPGISYYADTDASGNLTPADQLLTDTTGDGNPDTGALAPGASLTVLVAYAIPGSVADGDSAAVVVTAASDYEPLAAASVTDTISVRLPPELVVMKQVATVADPINAGNNPKAIPGSEMEYLLSVTNEGPGTVDSDAFVVTDAVPSGGCLVVTDIGGPGPLIFEDGTPASGLTYTFAGLASPTDDLDFSNDGGSSFGYTPSPNAAGCDPAVTHIRIRPNGTFAADTGSGSPEARFRFRIIVD
ncbi:MAG: hypothetical protein OEW35_02795 [Gammaproteobacteria bacterium]|nr:hypothetical protein [Gammaproteobacteria bacterium]MDH4254077.1 hypothetical protein [Gammaproteobacteria bacterium]MDH5310481.1 hypothetical protein [Gammaproteobacteria bacterium]